MEDEMVNWNEKLITAAQYGAIQEVKLCIQNLTDIDYENCVNTALLEAASNGHLEVIKLLFVSGCKKETTEIDGRTALHLAAGCGSLRLTRYLVEHIGICPLVTTNQGYTPYDLAAAGQRWQYIEVMEYLHVHILISYK
ncbi:ankyrin repeat domain-containing protein 39-like [Mytilus trossulus]|uniref:ankyrin repeat domain-containing protein 39-like n=1 Tax=Mytilus trossulus TaxID=6551 RepID=UPI00300556C3